MIPFPGIDRPIKIVLRRAARTRRFPAEAHGAVRFAHVLHNESSWAWTNSPWTMRRCPKSPVGSRSPSDRRMCRRGPALLRHETPVHADSARDRCRVAICPCARPRSAGSAHNMSGCFSAPRPLAACSRLPAPLPARKCRRWRSRWRTSRSTAKLAICSACHANTVRTRMRVRWPAAVRHRVAVRYRAAPAMGECAMLPLPVRV